ncbi:Uncharacterised protein [BD1-7 clade bacterium]|uniref:IraD/Gp25-like domain-containing protein n=1 Tax=BD1-7 clade bacterium TaxID=2029982 RepID=A0A5S9QPH1_9GAMM|nr:Uncharacterised protein [BD1-7 clade bacterium]CAA0121157.1 Uncharacterised protein [BD1-7 clade bacterium]
MDKINHTFLGTGWTFPPRFSLAAGSVETVTGVEDIEQSLTILLSTRIGERFLEPTYGCDLQEFLFAPLNSGNRALLEDTVRDAVLYHEPRIRLEKLLLSSSTNDGEVLIDIEYTVRTTNTRHNFVYPFYKDEGSEV